MFGGDLKRIDEVTFDLITNPTLLEINTFSVKNMEVFLFWDDLLSEKTNFFFLFLIV